MYMKEIQIIGIGVINRTGNTIEEIWNCLTGTTAVKKTAGKTQYSSVLPSRRLRRMNRYSDMAVYVSYKALDDADIAADSLDPYRIGTIFSTGYGPMESNLTFAGMVLDKDPDLCSPTVFANTVSNACIGHICMNLGCKGVSTIVMGSNSVGYAQMLLDKGDADYILSGAVEEYHEELYQCFKQNPYSANVDIAEAAVGFLLTSEKRKDAYCRLIDFVECDLGAYPLTGGMEETDIKPVETALRRFLDQCDLPVDAVFSAGNASWFDTCESEMLRRVLGGGVVYVDGLKNYVGETLGSSLSLSIAVAALCLKNQKIPEKLAEAGKEGAAVKTILATGYDVTGNYVAYLLAGRE